MQSFLMDKPNAIHVTWSVTYAEQKTVKYLECTVTCYRSWSMHQI